MDISNNKKPDGSFKVITLCGSTRFKKEFLDIQQKFTLAGYVVIAPGEYSKADGELELISEETENMLADLHKQKIDMADAIFVINKDNYIGDSTRKEIYYAMSQNKPISFLEYDEQQQILFKLCALLNTGIPSYYKDGIEKAILYIESEMMTIEEERKKND